MPSTNLNPLLQSLIATTILQFATRWLKQIRSIHRNLLYLYPSFNQQSQHQNKVLHLASSRLSSCLAAAEMIAYNKYNINHMRCFFSNSTFILSQMENTAAPVTPPTMLAAPPRKKAFHPPQLYIFFMHSSVPANFTASPDVIIILRRTVSSGYERAPETIAAKQPMQKVNAMFSSKWCGRQGRIESYMPKQNPRQIIMHMQDTVKPRQRPSKPSLRQVLLMQCINPLYSPPFPLLAWLASLVLAKSSGYTRVWVNAPAAAPASKFPRNLLSPYLSSIILRKRSLNEKLRACVRKNLRAFVALPLKKAEMPFSIYSLRKQSLIPAQRYAMTPFSMRASCTCSRSLTTSMGEAIDLEMYAAVPPKKNSLRKLRDLF